MYHPEDKLLILSSVFMLPRRLTLLDVFFQCFGMFSPFVRVQRLTGNEGLQPDSNLEHCIGQRLKPLGHQNAPTPPILNNLHGLPSNATHRSNFIFTFRYYFQFKTNEREQSLGILFSVSPDLELNLTHKSSRGMFLSC